MIDITNLNKSFKGEKVLENINLHIKEGEIFGIIGKSGAGKSTLLRCINKLENKDSGSIKVNGEYIEVETSKSIRNYRREIGMIFQHFSLLERQNVYKNISIPLECWGYKKEEIEKRVHNLINLVGLKDKINERPKNLSGGQRQRVAIARALALNPKILLCDEATSALDPKTTKDILSLLREINEKLNITIIMVTHQMEVVTEICSRASIIEKGTIKDVDSVKNMFLNQPGSLKRLIGKDEILITNKNLLIRLIYEENKYKENMLTELILKFKGDVDIVSSKLEKFRDEIITVSTISVNKNSEMSLKDYLNIKSISWEVINNG
ncbi:MAG: methionine ABC transporter ATP-binding protein [Clostridium sp.]